MTAPAIRQKLYEYIKIAEEKKIKAIYTMLEHEIETTYDWSDDQELLAEIEKRSADYKSGKVNGISWDEAIKTILNLPYTKKK